MLGRICFTGNIAKLFLLMCAPNFWTKSVMLFMLSKNLENLKFLLNSFTFVLFEKKISRFILFA